MQLRKLLLFILIAIRLCASPAFAQEKPLTAKERTQQKTLFKWLDTTLNLPDLAKVPIVRVKNPAWDTSGFMLVGTPAYKVEYGFLLKEEKETFTVLFTTTVQVTLRRTQSKSSASYEIMEPKTFLRRWFQPYHERDSFFGSDSVVYFGNEKWFRRFGAGGASDALDSLFFTRFYEARGDLQTADRFYRHFMVNHHTDMSSERMDLRHLSDDFYLNGTWHIDMLFDDPFLSRETILTQVRLMKQRFPVDARWNLYGLGATERLLVKMIQEDKEHAKKRLPPLEKMPLKERVAELIFRLRDAVSSHRSGFLIGGDEPVTKDPRYHSDQALIQIGYPAVPQLIEAFGDNRFTRSGETIGKRAQSIFSEISSYSFENLHASIKSSPADKDYQKAALMWWTNFQKKGERQTLIEKTSLGNRDSIAPAEKLVKAYPKDALPPLIKGFQSDADPYAHKRLMELITDFKQEAANALARSVMWKDRDVETRLVAAKMRWRQGDLEALKAMIETWVHPPAKPPFNPRDPSGDPFEDDYKNEQLADFLGHTKHPDAIRALNANLSTLKAGLLSTVMSTPFGSERFSDASPLHKNVIAEQLRVKAEYERSVETLLTSVLARLDKVNMGMTLQWKQRLVGWNPSSGRACDFAAALLAIIRPDKYRFDIHTSLRQREVQRLVLLNRWRAEQKLAPLPVPPLLTRKLPRNVVSQILFASDAPALPPAIRTHILAMQGAKPTSKTLSKQLEEILNNLPANTKGIYFEADSAGDGTGIRLFFQLIPGKVRGNTYNLGLYGDLDVKTGITDLGSNGFGSSLETLPEDALQAIERAFALPSMSPFEAILRLTVRKP